MSVDHTSLIEKLPPVMTVRSFADIFQFDVRTVYTMVHEKEIGCLRRSSDTIRILRTHVEDWIRRCDLSESPAETNGISDGLSEGELACARLAAQTSFRPQVSFVPLSPPRTRPRTLSDAALSSDGTLTPEKRS